MTAAVTWATVLSCLVKSNLAKSLQKIQHLKHRAVAVQCENARLKHSCCTYCMWCGEADPELVLLSTSVRSAASSLNNMWTGHRQFTSLQTKEEALASAPEQQRWVHSQWILAVFSSWSTLTVSVLTDTYTLVERWGFLISTTSLTI